MIKIEFKTLKDEDDYCSRECHEVYLDGKLIMSQSEMLEPEDVLFGRDLSSPFEMESLIEQVHKRGLAGEELEIINTEEPWE